jgi:mannosyltransferase OCH1-like enzyme
MRKMAVRKVRRILRVISHPSFLPIVSLLAKNALGCEVFRANIAQADSVDVLPGNGTQLAKSSASAEIPPIVFQTWKSCDDIPSNYYYWRSTFFRLNPGFDILLWDDYDNRNFIATQFPWFLSVYDSYPKEIFRADAVRPFFLFRYGGFYADMDSECLCPLSGLVRSGDILLGRMGADTDFPHSIPNAVMGSKPFQLFWLLFIAMMMEKASEQHSIASASEKPEVFTGPILLKQAVDFYSVSSQAAILKRAENVIRMLPGEFHDRMQMGRLTLLDPDVFYPIDWNNPIHDMLRKRLLRRRALLDHDTARKLFPRSLVMTYWAHGW